MKIFLVLCLLFSTFLFARGGELVYLEKSQNAPYSGYLATPEKMEKFRQINEEMLLLREKSLKQELLLKIGETELSFFKEDLEKTRKELSKTERTVMLKVGLAFIGGVLTTVGIGGLIIWLLP